MELFYARGVIQNKTPTDGVIKRRQITLGGHKNWFTTERFYGALLRQ
jgi:hypothetical protein